MDIGDHLFNHLWHTNIEAISFHIFIGRYCELSCHVRWILTISLLYMFFFFRISTRSINVEVSSCRSKRIRKTKSYWILFLQPFRHSSFAPPFPSRKTIAYAIACYIILCIRFEAEAELVLNKTSRKSPKSNTRLAGWFSQSNVVKKPGQDQDRGRQCGPLCIQA